MTMVFIASDQTPSTDYSSLRNNNPGRTFFPLASPH